MNVEEPERVLPAEYIFVYNLGWSVKHGRRQGEELIILKTKNMYS